MVYSYEAPLPWCQELARGLAAVLAAEADLHVYSEHLDAKRWPNLEHAEAFLSLLVDKYQHRPPDVLVVADDPAFELLSKKRDELFPGVPMIFMGLNGDRSHEMDDTPLTTGIFEVHRTTPTAELALDWTEAEGVVVINDSSETGLANEAEIERLQRSHPNVSWVIYRDLEVANIQLLMAHPPSWPILVMLPLRQGSADGPMISQAESVRLIRESAPNPLFYDVDYLLGHGIVGGYMFSGLAHAKQAAQMVLRVLQGTAVEDIPVRVETRHHWIFDYRELVRFGWVDKAPEGSVLRYQPPSFFESNRNILLPALGGLVAFSAVIAILSFLLTRYRKAESRLLAQRRRLLTALSASEAGVFEINPGHKNYASARFLDLVLSPPGAPLEESSWTARCTPPSRLSFTEAVDRLKKSSSNERVELHVEGPEGLRTLDVLMTVSQLADGKRTLVGVAQDVTSTRMLEEANSRKQRLNALGEFAGGIAHDFNNILTVINVNAEFIEEETEPQEIHRFAAEIRSSGLQAADLVRQLLAFGRQDPRGAGGIDLNDSIRGLHQFLQRLLGEQHELVSLLADEPVGTCLKGSQADQVLANLVLNARDAMPEGGTIQVESRVVREQGHAWSILQVKDHGIGMNAAVRSRVFEPFFTTKAIGSGTGLGLSTVYGILQATGGQVEIHSEPGHGATFLLRWPHLRVVGETDSPERMLDQPRGRTILVVEDEPSIALLTCSVLRRAGYSVDQAANGIEGLRTYKDASTPFDLVLTDVALPQMSGFEMAQGILKLNPKARIGFVSGYAGHHSVGRHHLPAHSELLGKPFSRSELLDYVDKCFHSESGHQPPAEHTPLGDTQPSAPESSL